MGFDADTGSVYLGRYLLMKDGVSDMRKKAAQKWGGK